MNRLGMEMKVYRQTTGTRGSWGTENADGVFEGPAPANLTEIGIVKDVTPDYSKGEADFTTRSNNGWRARRGVLIDGSVDLTLVYDTADAAYQAFQKSFLKRTKIALAILDGDKDEAGTKGFWADFEVFNFSDPQPLEDAVIVNINLKPTYSTVAPQMVEVTAS